MSSQPEDGWHGGSGSGDGQAPPAGNAAGDAAFPNPREPIQGAEGVLPATAPTQRTPGAVGPLQEGSKATRAQGTGALGGCLASQQTATAMQAAGGWAGVQSYHGAKPH